VGIFQENIIAKKGPKSKGKSWFFSKYNLFFINMLNNFPGGLTGPSSWSMEKDARRGHFFSQLGGFLRGGQTYFLRFSGQEGRKK
jgi:hypothetical protein